MKTFFYMGRNRRNVSGVSWKIWKIESAGRSVTTWWGPAHIHKRRPVPVGTLQSKTVRFSSATAAAEYETARIKNKRSKGYERRPRSRAGIRS